MLQTTVVLYDRNFSSANLSPEQNLIYDAIADRTAKEQPMPDKNLKQNILQIAKVLRLLKLFPHSPRQNDKRFLIDKDLFRLFFLGPIIFPQLTRFLLGVKPKLLILYRLIY